MAMANRLLERRAPADHRNREVDLGRLHPCGITPALKYPIDYLIKTVIPNSPPGFSLPFSRLTSPETLDATSCPQLLKGCADQVDADARTLPLEVGHAKCSLRLPDSA